MRHLYVFPLTCCLLAVGCVKSEKSEETKSSSAPKRNAVNNGLGIVVGDPDVRRPRGGNPQPPQPNNGFTERRVAGKRGYIGVTTDEVIDFKAAKQKNPRLRVLERPQGTEFFSNKYFGALGGLSQKLFGRAMQMHRATHGKYPTYKEYIALSQKQRDKVRLVKLPPWQKYAYEDRSGKLLILEDPDVKARVQKNGP